MVGAAIALALSLEALFGAGTFTALGGCRLSRDDLHGDALVRAVKHAVGHAGLERAVLPTRRRQRPRSAFPRIALRRR